MTGRSENRPVRAAAQTRSARASGATGEPPSARTLRRSPSSRSRATAVSRARDHAWTSPRPATRRTSWSTDGRRRRVPTASALIEGSLHLLADPRHYFLGFGSPGLGRPFPGSLGAPPADGVLGQPGPELVQVGGRQVLAAQGMRPLHGDGLDEAIALGGETPRAADELGQFGGHLYSLTSSRMVSTRLASKRRVDTHWYDP